MGTMCALLVAAAIATIFCAKVSARAVNISNTWMLPEEGFPVFYRYFRDRISWNEADAVCQFHHANLVTVDTTSQFDAVRAYLKELDITNNVWIGLSRPEGKSTFSWRDYSTLSAYDYWQDAIPATDEKPLCAVMDPAADFRWHALTCTGPETASFICELSVPSWANGPEGCLVTELPSLTMLYIPEQSSIELTSDCGLEGTKRIICRGNLNRDKLIKSLACTDDSIVVDGRVPSNLAQTFTSPATITTKHIPPLLTTKQFIWTSNTVDTGEYPTRNRRETEQTSTPIAPGPTPELPATIGTSQRPSATSGPPSETDTPSLLDGNQGEFASAINQGQLFSIIENGSMFDIIELNSTDENKTTISDASTNVYIHPSTLQSTAPYTSKSEHSLSKEALPDMSLNLAKGDDLHRTFRKQVPIFPKADTVDLDVNNDIQPLGNEQAYITTLSDNISDVPLSSTMPSDISTIRQKATNSANTDDARYESEPTTKPNRQRQLTRSNRRSFYPYFFSRVLG